jgi:hypothetical protein
MADGGNGRIGDRTEALSAERTAVSVRMMAITRQGKARQGNKMTSQQADKQGNARLMAVTRQGKAAGKATR